MPSILRFLLIRVKVYPCKAYLELRKPIADLREGRTLKRYGILKPMRS